MLRYISVRTRSATPVAGGAHSLREDPSCGRFGEAALPELAISTT